MSDNQKDTSKTFPIAETRTGKFKPQSGEKKDRADAHYVPGAEGPIGAEAEEDNNP